MLSKISKTQYIVDTIELLKAEFKDCNDNKNPAHVNAYKIYHERLKEYATIFN